MTEENDAILPEEDVSAGEPKHPRQALYEAMRAKREAREQPAAEPDDTAEPEDAAEPVEPKAPPVYEREGKWYAKRKVNGAEEEVPFDILMTEHQKSIAADRRLEEAAQRRQELDRREQALRQQEQEYARWRAQQDQARRQAEDAELPTLAKQYHEALLDGEEEKANELFLRMQKREPKRQELSQDAIIDSAIGRLKAESWEQREKDARAWLHREHADITQDTDLMQVASTKAMAILQERIAEGQRSNPRFTAHDVDPQGIYETAIERTREWLRKQATATPNSGARVERKRSASGKTVTGNNTTRASLHDREPRPLTTAEKVAQMRKARGLPV